MVAGSSRIKQEHGELRCQTGTVVNLRYRNIPVFFDVGLTNIPTVKYQAW